MLIVGGIGITPFRSMIKYLLDKNERRDITLFYSNKTASEIAYKDVLEEASQSGIKIINALTTSNEYGENINDDGMVFRNGRISQEMIAKEAPDYAERVFYVSGPGSMVTAFGGTLKDLGVRDSRIKTDFFPGFA